MENQVEEQNPFRIQFFEGNEFIGEFVSSKHFNANSFTINRHRVRRIRNSIAENMNVPQENIKSVVYSIEGNFLYQV